MEKVRDELDGHVLIGIGASAGGVEALSRLVPELPAELPAAVVVVLHMAPDATSDLPRILSRAGQLPAAFARDGEALTLGRILVAPPDRHTVVREGAVRLVRAPRENGSRPAIDPLFRSAAREHGPRFVGVVLSGTLDDGSAGLVAVRREGGLAVVQDPADALFPEMPLNALETAGADHRVDVAAMAPLLVQLAIEGRRETMAPRRKPRLTPAEGGQPGHPPGAPSPFSCPDCGGVLWEAQPNGDGATRFECRTGHAYGSSSLASRQQDGVEGAVWAAIRALEENAALSRRLSERARDRGAPKSARRFAEKAEENEHRVRVLRSLVGAPPPALPGAGREEPEKPARRGSAAGATVRRKRPRARRT